MQRTNDDAMIVLYLLACLCECRRMCELCDVGGLIDRGWI